MSGSLPTFLIIGAAKAGTTSIHSSLAQHPEVFVPDIKEPHFFGLEGKTEPFTGPGDDYLNTYGIRTLAEYERLFAPGAGKKARGEASPWYLVMEGVVENIQRHVPDAQLFAILRNPVDRAYSSYLHVVRDGRESSTFEEGLEREQERIAAGWEPIWHYVRAGMYADSIRRFQDAFGDQLRVVLYEDMVSDMPGMMRDLYTFIGVDPNFQAESERLNATGVPTNAIGKLVFQQNPLKRAVRALVPPAMRQKLVAASSKKLLSRPTMDPATRERLKATFKSDILELQGLLNRDLSGWL